MILAIDIEGMFSQYVDNLAIIIMQPPRLKNSSKVKTKQVHFHIRNHRSSCFLLHSGQKGYDIKSNVLIEHKLSLYYFLYIKGVRKILCANAQ